MELDGARIKQLMADAHALFAGMTAQACASADATGTVAWTTIASIVRPHLTPDLLRGLLLLDAAARLKTGTVPDVFTEFVTLCLALAEEDGLAF